MKADWRPQKYRLIPKWGAAPFAAVFSPLGAPSGKCAIWLLEFQPPKGAKYHLPVLFMGK